MWTVPPEIILTASDTNRQYTYWLFLISDLNMQLSSSFIYASSIDAFTTSLIHFFNYSLGLYFGQVSFHLKKETKNKKTHSDSQEVICTFNVPISKNLFYSFTIHINQTLKTHMDLREICWFPPRHDVPSYQCKHKGLNLQSFDRFGNFDGMGINWISVLPRGYIQQQLGNERIAYANFVSCFQR